MKPYFPARPNHSALRRAEGVSETVEKPADSVEEPPENVGGVSASVGFFWSVMAPPGCHVTLNQKD
jgi:hypothetical protein